MTCHTLCGPFIALDSTTLTTNDNGVGAKHSFVPLGLSGGFVLTFRLVLRGWLASVIRVVSTTLSRLHPLKPLGSYVRPEVAPMQYSDVFSVDPGDGLVTSLLVSPVVVCCCGEVGTTFCPWNGGTVG